MRLFSNSACGNRAQQRPYLSPARAALNPAVSSKVSVGYFGYRYLSLPHSSQPGAAKKTCWSCGTETSLPSVLCDNLRCKVIQPVGKGVTYYDVLLDGQHPSFDVDVSTLRRNFLKLQQLVHPDSFSQMGDTERKLAEIQSSWVNHANATLKDPLLRAFYMLELKDKGIGEEDQITDPELLMEIMELREEIETSETEKDISNIKERNDAKIDEVTNSLSSAFGAANYDSAKQLTNHLQYLRRVAQAIHSWEPGKPVIISH
ncbi:molecular chaperone [Coemansia sp. RSA 2399]|nr:molecular chaperone [Coemansia sp. RSA 2399]